MNVVLRRSLPAILVLAAVAQLVPVERTNPPATGAIADVPGPVGETLRRACYDCHSRETVWPWYSRVAPASWLVAHDVAEGREDLDFSTWTTLRPRRQAKLLGEIVETVEAGEMPPWIYRIAHPEARLTDEARAGLVAWARRARTDLVPGPP